MAETRVQGLDLDSLIELVRRAADAQEAQAADQVGTQKPKRFTVLDAVGCGGLFPKDRAASSTRPRERKGEGLNAVELQMQQMDVERDLAQTLFDSTRSLEKTTKESEEAQQRLEAVRQILERQVERSMGRRSVRRGEWREERNQRMDNDRDYWFNRNRQTDWDSVDYRRLQQQLELMRQP